MSILFGSEENILNAKIIKGENAQLSSLAGAMAVADLIKTTLGPKGMDKILQSSDPNNFKVTITNDGATILKNIPINNPSAKILVDISKTQDDEVGDGTTSVVVLAGELLREAERLMAMKIHPQTIIAGWRKAVCMAIKTLQIASINNGDDPILFRQDLLNIAKTTLSSKIINTELNLFSELCVDAVLRLKGNPIEMIHIIKKKGGQLKDSFLSKGFILDKEFGIGQKKILKNPKIMVANTSMDTDKIKIFGARVRVSSVTKVSEIESVEKEKMKNKVEKILKHNINLFINRQLIYNYPEAIFTEAKVNTIEHADFEGVEQLALVLDAEIVSTFDNLEQVKYGTCEYVKEILVGEDRMIKFISDKKSSASTIILRGSSDHIIAEAERSVHDALCVLSQTITTKKIVLGGGASEMYMALKIDELARKTSGKQAFAMEAFSRALRQIPTILADNGGYDASELVSKLRSFHEKGMNYMGLNMHKGNIENVKRSCIIESYKSKSQSLISAHEAAEMILRVDEIIQGNKNYSLKIFFVILLKIIYIKKNLKNL